MSLRAQLVAIATVAVAIEVALGIAVMSTGGPARIAAFLLASAVATAVVATALWWLLGLPRRDDGDGGGGPAGAPPPLPWWPGIERSSPGPNGYGAKHERARTRQHV